MEFYVKFKRFNSRQCTGIEYVFSEVAAILSRSQSVIIKDLIAWIRMGTRSSNGLQ